jgi:predicted DNA-binding transcriptional regulator AlpA
MELVGDARGQPEPWVTTRDVAEHLGKPVSWVYGAQRLGIPRVKIGNQLRYRLSRIDEWIESLQRDPGTNGTAP